MDTEQLIRDVVKNVLEKLGLQDISGRTVNNPGSGIQNTLQDAGTADKAGRKIVCGVSVRHIHLCREDLDILFGKDYSLNVFRELYNPGFASKETLTLVGPKLTAIQNVRILGPLRPKTQVELAKTDCIVLGIDAPVRPSGEISGSSTCVLVGPKGAVYLNEGVIRANRHLHMGTDDAEFYGIKDNQVVDIRVPGPKGLTFNNVQVRVAPDFKTEFHVDTDDGNAADITNGSIVEIVDASCISPIEMQMASPGMIPPSIPDGSFIGEISDPNLLKNICSVATGAPCTREQVQKAMGKVIAGSGKEKIAGSASVIGRPGSDGKTLITVADLDSYLASGITVNKDVILSPLAKDEAVKRGIQINFEV